MSALDLQPGDLDLWDEGASPLTEVCTLPHVHHDTGPVPAITEDVVRAHLCPTCTGHGANLPICNTCPKWLGGAA